MTDWAAVLRAGMAARLMEETDAAHDLGHLDRVCHSALAIAAAEGGDPEVLTAAAYLHDLVNLPKDHPERATASRHSAEAARARLAGLGFPAEKLDAVAHAIEAHSFSAGIAPRTAEARILQDADRLEALGAIGIARVFYTAARMGAALFDPEDPGAATRPLDDRRFALDHFRVKLFAIADTLHTPTARAMAARRVALMRDFTAAMLAEAEGR